MTETTNDVIAELRGQVGCITLNRPRALNALSLGMVRELMAVLLDWQKNDQVLAVAIRGSNKEGAFGAFCAGGDIRFLHQAGTVGNPQLEDFFTEEYALNHLIHNFGKPYIAFMDGIVMGGGMGISQGASLRVVTERTKMAMPETIIGLFPDVGGGYFLSRCPGRVGEWLALSGETIGAADAIAFKLADGFLPADQQAGLWDASPRSREIIYNFARLRALRVEVDVRLATGQFTIAQAADYLARTVPMDAATALEEAASFAAGPGQAITYQIGKLQTTSQLADARRAQGAAFSLRRFHDTLWKNGNVPFALLRWELLDDRRDVDRLATLK